MNLPNTLSALRILLTPLFVLLYRSQRPAGALAVLLVCAVSDVADGMIARRFHMESELGKVLDPVGDKLIQAAMMLCACMQTPLAWLLLGLHALRELLLAGLGLWVLRRTGRVYGARWYGKLCTGVIYAAMLLLLFFPDETRSLHGILLLCCGSLMLFCLGMYAAAYGRLLRRGRERPAG